MEWPGSWTDEVHSILKVLLLGKCKASHEKKIIRLVFLQPRKYLYQSLNISENL